MSEIEIDVVHPNSIKNKMKSVQPEDTNFIKCSNCEKKLAQIFEQSLSDKVFYKLVVECPFCKDKSFSRDIKGKVGIHPCAGVGFINIETNDITMTNLYKTCKV